MIWLDLHTQTKVRLTKFTFIFCYRGELLAAKPLRPWSSSIRTGVEGDFSRQVSSKEHFPERPYARVMPDVRRPSLSVPGFGHSFTNDTTYHASVENVVQVSIRFNKKYKFVTIVRSL